MLLSSERRQARQPELRRKYNDFLTEYLALDHMEIVPRGHAAPSEAYYMPHHAVFKASDPASKIRVVFNASARTTSTYSLNDCLLPGPRLQADLWLVITRWRMFRVGFLADIVKMFRQVRIHKEDADLQRIVWRPELTGEVRDFRLLTVTYGARELQNQLVAILREGGFALSKWASNDPSLCIRTGQEECVLPAGEVVSALGIRWDPAADTLTLKVTLPSDHKAVTKRVALSEVARLFDPLGWVAPVLIFGKIFIQDLRVRGCDWDEPLDTELKRL
ncbi:uncharacterized protein LOC114946190 [Nylanderia fulva]|uniref:uncharacterized protein LOC114946190 n=1 Tax=Nylanderia fulva TaxID=613905 RepID=UPI0010FB4AF8|nr:uncharacterized protein LOC114946190 [Nylanderia fulva]